MLSSGPGYSIHAVLPERVARGRARRGRTRPLIAPPLGGNQGADYMPGEETPCRGNSPFSRRTTTSHVSCQGRHRWPCPPLDSGTSVHARKGTDWACHVRRPSTVLGDRPSGCVRTDCGHMHLDCPAEVAEGRELSGGAGRCGHRRLHEIANAWTQSRLLADRSPGRAGGQLMPSARISRVLAGLAWTPASVHHRRSAHRWDADAANGLGVSPLVRYDLPVPFRGTGTRSSTDRASDYGSEGWEFESLRVRSTSSSVDLGPEAVARHAEPVSGPALRIRTDAVGPIRASSANH